MSMRSLIAAASISLALVFLHSCVRRTVVEMRVNPKACGGDTAVLYPRLPEGEENAR